MLRSFPKSHEAWAHRRWLLRQVWRALSLGPQQAGAGAGTAAGAGAAAEAAAGAGAAWSSLLLAELALWAIAQPQRPANYHAARHLAACLAPRAPPPPAAALAAALRLSSALSCRCPSHPSVLHCRRAVLHAALHAAPPDALPADDAPPAAAQPPAPSPAASAAQPAAIQPAASAGGPLVYEEGEYPGGEGLVHEEMCWAERRLAQARA